MRWTEFDIHKLKKREKLNGVSLDSLQDSQVSLGSVEQSVTFVNRIGPERMHHAAGESLGSPDSPGSMCPDIGFGK
ncbi:hypothetical protein IRJ41_001944 [Triplophysa rosa]|uniref:Uncharacterized protein n=1 Tax=Triplophysa rosa TaxID=992332 RepID=A0A9W7TE67_TRIRA|nr:hypothetical protein IRJ41_001944 [Triplophysa rosa]